MGWIVFAFLFAVYKITGRKQPGKGKGSPGEGGGHGGGRGGKGGKSGKIKLIIGIAREALLFTAVCSLAFAPLPFTEHTVGSLLAAALNFLLLGWLSSLISVTATLVASVLLGICVVIAVWDVVSDREIDKPAKNALVAMPFLVFAAGGPVTAIITKIVSSVDQAATSAVATLFMG